MTVLNSKDFYSGKQKAEGTQSLTRTINRYIDETSNDSFFIKTDPCAKEYRRLQALYDRNISIPRKFFFLEDTQELATLGEGKTLNIFMKENHQKFFELLFTVSSIIKNINTRLQRIDESIVCKDASHTAHPILNFTSRFIEEKSDASNVFLNSTGADIRNLGLDEKSQNSLIHLYYHVKTIIHSYYNRVNVMKNDCNDDKEVAYGDLKPENIIVDKRGELYLIDPFFVKGSKYFDITKFVSRLLLEGVHPTNAIQFLSFYDGEIDLNKKVYRNLSQRELINIDMVNILSSYLGRFISGEQEYRLVNNLSKHKISDLWRKALNEAQSPPHF